MDKKRREKIINDFNKYRSLMLEISQVREDLEETIGIRNDDIIEAMKYPMDYETRELLNFIEEEEESRRIF